MTKKEQLKELKEELAWYQRDKDPYFEEQARLIRRMPVEIVKHYIPKTGGIVSSS